MSKTIVAHISVDLDAIASTWFVKRFMPGWHEAQLAFVSAGTTLNNADPDSNPEIIHVDTGLGQFDHHQLKDIEKQFSATRRVFDHLVKEKHVNHHDHEALERMVNFITSIDHFGELYFHDPKSDLYDFNLHQIIDGFKVVLQADKERCEIVFHCLDSIFYILKQKILAEEEMRKGYIFNCKWGKGLAMETKNEEALKQALKSDYKVVIKRNPHTGYVRIKSWPISEIDLTPVFEKIMKVDSRATWFLHISKNMLLNGSSKDPDAVASSLSLKKVVEIITSIT